MRPFSWRDPERPFAAQADRIQFLEKGTARKSWLSRIWERLR